MVSCLPGQLSPQQLSPKSELDLWLVELYYLIRTTLLFIPFESNLKWLINVQLSIRAVVAWAVVAWANVPPIRTSFVAS